MKHIYIQEIYILVISGTAVLMDLRKGKIYNSLIFTGLCLGLWFQVYQKGPMGIVYFSAGALLPAILLFLLFWIRALGAGDIKLLAVLGGFLGIRQVLICIIISFSAGAVLSAFVLILNHNMWFRLQYLAAYITEYNKTKKWEPYYKKEHSHHTIHFSIPIFISVLARMGGFF